MDESKLQQVYDELDEWCRQRSFAGADPFDALNSPVFQSTPVRGSRIARLAWTQALKRSPTLRNFALLPAQQNSKGIALFALAALASYRRAPTDVAEAYARARLDDLWEMRLGGYSGAAWGYNFPWQSRKFFAPKGTPMIVPTAFAVRALVDAHQTFGDKHYLEKARSSCDFIMRDLRRTSETTEEVCFSYSPLDNTRIFNASLFAAETLAVVGSLMSQTQLCELAERGTRFVTRRQNQNGSWTYGEDAGQNWIDNFHTAYVLTSLARIEQALSIDLSEALQRGYQFWRTSFFLADGWPKYYDTNPYPADAHAAATAIITLLELRDRDSDALSLAETIAGWTIKNLRDPRGFFYAQRRRFHTVRTPYMRWTQAWMLYALARLLEVK